MIPGTDDSQNPNKQILEQPVNEKVFKLESLDMVKTGMGPKILGICLFVFLILAIIFVLFIPWRQSVVGAGKIIDFSSKRAAAILMSDYDAPLIRIGDPARLTISGWPSLQFAGWPSVATGTFAGRVAVIDAVTNGKHFYCIIVVPDYEAIAQKKEEPWPSPKYLRPGTKTTGWVLLRKVPVWYELWRQFNGFQPIVNSPETSNSTGEN